MGITVKPQAIYLGAGIIRSAWRIYDDEVLVDYAFSEPEAKLKVENLQEQREHRDGA